MQDQPVTCGWRVVWAREEQEQCMGVPRSWERALEDYVCKPGLGSPGCTSHSWGSQYWDWCSASQNNHTWRREGPSQARSEGHWQGHDMVPALLQA